MALDPKTKLARLNMSFELGLFLASKSFGSGQQKRKVALIFDRGGYRYRKALSDISGQDISHHEGRPKKAIREVRNWLDTCQGGAYSLPGGEYIVRSMKNIANNCLLRQRAFISTQIN
jgi:hypothetical protein